MKFPGTNEDLISRLTHKPEMKAEVASAFNPTQIENEPEPPEAKIETNDFDPDPAEVKIETDPEPKPEIKTEPVKPYSYYEREAKGIIGFLDGISTIFLPGVYKKRLITDEGIKRGEEIEDLIKDGKRDELSAEDIRLMDHFIKVQAAIKEIPFKPEEKEMLIGPMAEVMQKYATALGPEWRLVFAVGAVSFPRLIPLWKGV
jgi:hypothetical protein